MYQLSLRRFGPPIISSLKPAQIHADGLRIHDTTSSIILYVLEHKKGCNICKVGGSEQKWFSVDQHRIHQAYYIECHDIHTHITIIVNRRKITTVCP
jgi:hypothetical protein